MTRLFDILLSLLGIIIFSPIWVLIVIGIALDSKGPILFRQRRVGKDGVEFKMFKFRTMRVNAEQKGYLTVGNEDSRITAFGCFLRRYKLDELPQLLNVLRNDMSIVGPRPEVRKYVDLYKPEERAVLTVLPGITDFASVAFRNENDLLAKQQDPENYYIQYIMPEKIRLNQTFISEPTATNYFRVIILTLRKVFEPISRS
ncbi:sugar transferase [Polluticoccus soli]|uniref:sugar transferase n=1 Tax=Polluticoccus soli TaxID=3034150 RepID=UPI0023E2165A|nr:sugar transferase [Flavipsychrobacter sp. JY13-12]